MKPDADEVAHAETLPGRSCASIAAERSRTPTLGVILEGMRAQARFLKTFDGIPSLAEIELETVPGAGVTTFALTGAGFASQGYVEDATDAYVGWKQGAAAGIAFALRETESDVHVIVHRISGLTTDTNASSVAAVAAMATWRALGVEATPEWTKTLEDAARHGWEAPEEPPIL